MLETETIQQVIIDEVVSVIHRLSDKQYAIDPAPTQVLMSVASDIAPYLCESFNRSLPSDYVARLFKEPLITRLLKKPDLDTVDVE